MKRLMWLWLLALACMPSLADNLKTTVDSSDNVLSVKIMKSKDLKRVPVDVYMDNLSVPMTCVQCYLQLSDSSNVFCKDEDGKSILFSRTTRWTPQHQTLLTWNTKKHTGSLMALVVSPKSENFKGTTGPVLTVYMDLSSLADGKYTLRMHDANMVWTDKRKISTYLTPDTEATFVKKGNKLLIQ
jgi:hypothetical protein